MRLAISSDGRLAAQLLHQLARGADQLVDGLDHVHRDADGAGLVGDGAGDGLANPPGGVGRELVAAAVLELVDRLHQADVAFLNEVEELQAAVGVLLGDGDHQAQVGFDQLALGVLGIHVALDDLALRAPQSLKLAPASCSMRSMSERSVAALAAQLLLLLFGAAGGDAILQVLNLLVERLHAVDGLVDAVDQVLALAVGEPQVADDAGDLDLLAAQCPAAAAIFARPASCPWRESRRTWRPVACALPVMLVQLVDAGR